MVSREIEMVEACARFQFVARTIVNPWFEGLESVSERG